MPYREIWHVLHDTTDRTVSVPVFARRSRLPQIAPVAVGGSADRLALESRVLRLRLPLPVDVDGDTLFRDDRSKRVWQVNEIGVVGQRERFLEVSLSTYFSPAIFGDDMIQSTQVQAASTLAWQTVDLDGTPLRAAVEYIDELRFLRLSQIEVKYQTLGGINAFLMYVDNDPDYFANVAMINDNDPLSRQDAGAAGRVTAPLWLKFPAGLKRELWACRLGSRATASFTNRISFDVSFPFVVSQGTYGWNLAILQSDQRSPLQDSQTWPPFGGNATAALFQGQSVEIIPQADIPG